MAAYYFIRVKGYLDHCWAAWFDGLTLTHEVEGTTLLEGPVTDQAALHGILDKIRDLGLPLLAVSCIDPNPAPNAARDRPAADRRG